MNRYLITYVHGDCTASYELRSFQGIEAFTTDVTRYLADGASLTVEQIL